MNIIGKWTVSATMGLVDGDFKWLTKEEAEKTEDYDEKTYAAVTEFTPDGIMRDLMKIPDGMSKEEIDEAISAGYERVGDYLAFGKRQWKEEDGKILYNTEIQGEFAGDEVSPWAEISEDENSEITLMDMIRLKRM